MNKESYQKVSLTVWDVIKMTEDEFLLLTSIPNWQKIRIDGNVPYMSLASCIAEFNPEIYKKYKLLLEDVEEVEEDGDNELLEQIEREMYKVVYNKNNRFYKAKFLETYEVGDDDNEEESDWD